MKIFIIILLVGLAFAVQTNEMRQAMKQLIQQKARLTKSSTDGKETHPILRAHGSGITDSQENLVVSIIDQAAQIHGSDIYSNSLFIQQKVEDSFSGRWNVEVFGNDPSWGRATYINNEQWILLFGYGNAGWDYIIWAPSC